MKPTQYDFDDLDSDNHSANGTEGGRSTATLPSAAPSETTAAAEWTGPRCEKCAAPLKADVVCRSCGWYASLGTFVEVDPHWDKVDDGKDDAQAPQPSHVRVWIELIPVWGWIIIGCVLAIVVESIVARFVTEAGSSLRTTWSLTQLAIGAIAVIGCHFWNFLVQVSDDPDVGILDVVLKPVKLWLRTFRHLPARLWLVDSLASGLTAIVMSIVVIGGIPYDRLWDWGFTPPPKQELMGAIMDRVKKLETEEEKSLEEAIGDFAGKAGVDDAEKTPPKPNKTADCVILGYTIDLDGRLNTLVLGTAHLGQLVYAGNVTPKFDSRAESNELLKKLAAARTTRRIIPIQTEAIWVKPTLSCRVFFGERKPDGRLMDIQWNEFIGSMRTQSQSGR
jgi:hypothetical protein